MSADTVQPLLHPYPEAQQLLGAIGRTTLDGLCDRGDVTRVKIGRRGFITAESIAAYVNRLADAANA